MITRKCLKASAAARKGRTSSLANDPYYLGDEAWNDRVLETANPFVEGTEDHADWLRGWRDALREFELRQGV